MINKNDVDGVNLYVRVDFNNALNGLMTVLTKNKAPERGFTMKELKDNMFNKITCKYSEELNKYIYNINNDNGVIKLYEAKVK